MRINFEILEYPMVLRNWAGVYLRILAVVGAGSPKCQEYGILTGSVHFIRKPPSSATYMMVLQLAAHLNVQESVCALCFALYGTLKKEYLRQMSYPRHAPALESYSLRSLASC